MSDLAAKLASIPDEELGAWMRKAVADWQNGCADTNTDRFVREVFEKALEKMKSTQEIQAKNYRNRLARNGKETVALVNQTDVGAGSLRGLKSANGVSHCSEAPASNLLQLDNTKKQYGTFRHVRLSDEDGKELREVFGPRLKDAIEFLDNYIESLPSKKAGDKKCGTKYWQEDYEAKNHKLCMLRWVKKALDENEITELNKKAAEARLKKAESTPKSFQQMERDRTSRVLRGESADGKNIVRDEDLTPEELEAKYA